MHLIDILNSAARLILNVPKFSRISSTIRDELHWLQNKRRIRFKIALLVFWDRCDGAGLPGGAVPSGELVVPKYRLQKSGHKAFAVSGSQIWNLLPVEIRLPSDNLMLFKKNLKTHLFQQSWSIVYISESISNGGLINVMYWIWDTGYQIHWNLIITLMLGSIRNQCYNRIVL